VGVPPGWTGGCGRGASPRPRPDGAAQAAGARNRAWADVFRRQRAFGSAMIRLCTLRKARLGMGFDLL